MDKVAAIEQLTPMYGRREAIAIADWIAEEPEESYNFCEVIARLQKRADAIKESDNKESNKLFKIIEEIENELH